MTALFDRIDDFFRPAFVPALLATPSEKLARLVREAVMLWKERYARERKGNGHAFCVGAIDAKKLKTLAPRDQPRIAALAEPTRACVKALRDAKLVKPADALARDLEAFVAM